MDILIKAAKIVDGTSAEPVEKGAILISGSTILKVGRQSELKVKRRTEVLDVGNKTVIPGLMDCHVHFCGDYHKWIHRKFLHQQITKSVLLGVNNAKGCIEAGVLTVRDAGCGHLGIFQMRDSINSGQILGPRLLVSGRPIAMTGGHCWPFSCEADGPYEVCRAVREQLRWGVDSIKFMATGGGDEYEEMSEVQMNLNELAAGVKEAKKKKKRTLAHADNPEGALNCVKAGVNSIEHGLVLNNKVLNAVKNEGSFYVPTAYTHWLTATKGKEIGATEWDIRKCKEILGSHREAIQKAYRMGINIATGTDYGYANRPLGSSIVSEIEFLVNYGMSPMDAIKAATYVSACNLGIEKSVGTIQRGKIADILVIDGNPLDNISNLRRVSLVMKEGLIVYET
jgi:imidazolonepropionase-like amidohydrolase